MFVYSSFVGKVPLNELDDISPRSPPLKQPYRPHRPPLRFSRRQFSRGSISSTLNPRSEDSVGRGPSSLEGLPVKIGKSPVLVEGGTDTAGLFSSRAKSRHVDTFGTPVPMIHRSKS